GRACQLRQLLNAAPPRWADLVRESPVVGDRMKVLAESLRGKSAGIGRKCDKRPVRVLPSFRPSIVPSFRRSADATARFLFAPGLHQQAEPNPGTQAAN